MKKKQLNRRQLWRIQKMQNAFATRAEKEEVLSKEAFEEKASGRKEQEGLEEQKGIVISNFGQQLDIEAIEGKNQGKIFRCYQRSNLDLLVAGDYVIWKEGDPDGVVVAALPRENYLERPTGMGELKPVAANIDQIIIVIAPAPEPFGNLVDRYLVAAEYYRIKPFLLLNKSDLITQENNAALDKLLNIYRHVGYTVLTVGAKTGDNIDALKTLLENRTSVFVGQSGVGKSALVNTLLPKANSLVGSLSAARDKGKHTTTAARLYHFPDGGDLIDSPGIREFHLEHLDQSTLLEGFVEFRPYLDQCKFRDCRHNKEPGCALNLAVSENKILQERMDSYRQIHRTLKPE